MQVSVSEKQREIINNVQTGDVVIIRHKAQKEDKSDKNANNRKLKEYTHKKNEYPVNFPRQVYIFYLLDRKTKMITIA
jgi:hypothetical protein